MADLEDIKQRLILIENALNRGQELDKEQKEELRRFRLALPQKEVSEEESALHDRISRIRGWNSRLISAHYRQHLEDEIDRLSEELRLPYLTPERRATIIEELRSVHKDLVFISR